MNLQYTVSIKKDTNKLISSSTDKFVGIKNGTLIKLEDNPILYTIIGKESFFYIKDFKTQNSKIIVINEDVDINLQKDDILKFTYKEYEGKFILKIIEEGNGYIPGEVIVKNGSLSIDLSSGSNQPTLLEISEIDSNGSVKNIEIKNSGKYIIPPNNPIEVYSKNGDGLLLDIKYLETSLRSSIDRVIKDIYIQDNKTYIVLDYSLPPNVIEGKISCEKNTLLLSTYYTDNTKRNIGYQIFSHFTPNLGLPLLVKNSLSQESIYNKSCLILDEEIGKIKKQLNIK